MKPLLAALCALWLVTGCATALKAGGYPPEAARTTPPSALSERALAVGQPVPDAGGVTPDGETWRLQDALAQGPVVLVFYRGHW